jgi:undecaprenyldiphospho-muramoylpentapeptide beta-N-acetylglucosaminyltransferase
MKETFVVIAGGGTAGHLHPGLAVAEALVSSGKQRSEIYFLASDREIDSKLITAANFEFTGLRGKGVGTKSMISVLVALTLLMKSTTSAWKYISKSKPKVILSLGGFASLPGSIAGLITRTPVVLHEQNAVPGRANKLISKWAKKSAVSYQKTGLPRSVHTGNPVRKELFDLNRSDKPLHRGQLGIPLENKVVVATGGSLGSTRINESIIGALVNLNQVANLTIYHIIGNRDWDKFKQPLSTHGIDYRAVEYEEQMPIVINSADLIISRAGGSITAEIKLIGIPSILVPLPGAPGDHQTKNAESLVEGGLAVIIPDSECNSERIAEEIKDILFNEKRLDDMANARSGRPRKNAAECIATLLTEEAK